MHTSTSETFCNGTFPLPYNISMFMLISLSLWVIVRSKSAVFQRYEKTYLPCDIIERKQGVSENECGLSCVVQETCTLVNYKTASNGQNLCELISENLKENFEMCKRKHHPKFFHLKLIEMVSESLTSNFCHTRQLFNFIYRIYPFSFCFIWFHLNFHPRPRFESLVAAFI